MNPVGYVRPVEGSASAKNTQNDTAEGGAPTRISVRLRKAERQRICL